MPELVFTLELVDILNVHLMKFTEKAESEKRSSF